MVEPTSFVGAYTVTKSQVVLKVAVVVNAVLLVTGGIAYRCGAFNRSTQSTPRPAESVTTSLPEPNQSDSMARPTPGIMPSNKSGELSFGGRLNGTFSETMPGSKSTTVFRPSDTSAPQQPSAANQGTVIFWGPKSDAGVTGPMVIQAITNQSAPPAAVPQSASPSK
jgi:hypothetical protein